MSGSPRNPTIVAGGTGHSDYSNARKSLRQERYLYQQQTTNNHQPIMSYPHTQQAPMHQPATRREEEETRIDLRQVDWPHPSCYHARTPTTQHDPRRKHSAVPFEEGARQMIMMFLMNPAAFVVCLLVGAGFLEGYDRYYGQEPNGWLGLGVIVGAYLLAARYLPWWTRPLLLWRWWRSPKQPQPLLSPAPLAPPRPPIVSPSPAPPMHAKQRPARFCTNCGGSVAIGDKYCATCGCAITRR